MGSVAPMDIAIRLLGAADVEVYRALRLRSLAEHPEAYGASFSEESARGFEEDRARLAAKEGRDDDLVLAAFDGSRAVGLVGVVRQAPHRSKLRHKAMLWGVYVAPEARGRGVGRLLIEAALREISRAADIELVQLGVGAQNQAARALYLATGFAPYGVERRAIRTEAGYVDEELMVRFL